MLAATRWQQAWRAACRSMPWRRTTGQVEYVSGHDGSRYYEVQRVTCGRWRPDATPAKMMPAHIRPATSRHTGWQKGKERSAPSNGVKSGDENAAHAPFAARHSSTCIKGFHSLQGPLALVRGVDAFKRVRRRTDLVARLHLFTVAGNRSHHLAAAICNEAAATRVNPC